MYHEPRIIDQIEHWRAEAEAQLAARQKAEAVRDRFAVILRDIRDNWDCDSDSHKYGTPCRCCLAREALLEIEQ